jgi:hypothetical protein
LLGGLTAFPGRNIGSFCDSRAPYPSIQFPQCRSFCTLPITHTCCETLLRRRPILQAWAEWSAAHAAFYVKNSSPEHHKTSSPSAPKLCVEHGKLTSATGATPGCGSEQLSKKSCCLRTILQSPVILNRRKETAVITLALPLLAFVYLRTKIQTIQHITSPVCRDHRQSAANGRVHLRRHPELFLETSGRLR